MDPRQLFENRARLLRCTFECTDLKPPPLARVEIVVWQRGERVASAVGVGSKRKDAYQDAYWKCFDLLKNVPDPCPMTMPYIEFCQRMMPKPPVCLFKEPPTSWFEKGQVLGIDWEGFPPSLVQIACASGVYVELATSPTALKILNDVRHTHCVYGKHKMHMVANPVNLQEDVKVSLVDVASESFFPNLRLLKDHFAIDWKEIADNKLLSPEAAMYAATDAIFTRCIGLKKKGLSTDDRAYLLRMLSFEATRFGAKEVERRTGQEAGRAPFCPRPSFCCLFLLATWVAFVCCLLPPP